MHTIEPARLKPGVDPDSLPEPRARSGAGSGRLIRGKALIFWDPKSLPARAARKLDAIDTDQITPAADCVSESLETLDERWKAGSFRYLMPDFRARVHRGRDVRHRRRSLRDRLVARDEPGRPEGRRRGGRARAGDRLRPQHGRHLPAQRVQPRAARRAESRRRSPTRRTATTFTFDPGTRQLRNETQGKTYTPVPLSPKEDEIRRSGGIFAVGRREFADVGRARAPGDRLGAAGAARARHDDDRADRLGAPRRQGRRRASSSRARRCASTPTCCRPPTARRRSRSTRSTRSPAATRSIPRQAAIANDHFVFTGDEADDKQTAIGREFARVHGIEKPYYATPGDGIFHFYFPEQGLVMPGQFIPGADSHSRAYGAYGAVGIGVGSTTLGFGWATGYIYFTLAAAAARRLRRAAPALGQRQGHRARAAAALGREAVAGHVGRVRRRGPPAADRLPQHDRQHDGRGRGAERHLRARRRSRYAWYRRKGMTIAAVSAASRRAPTRVYEIDETLDLADVAPMIAKPFSPGNAFPAEEVARERITFDKAMIGSCTNGSYDDLLQAALVLRAARDARARKTVERELRHLPGLGRRRPADRAAGSAARRRVDRRGLPRRRRRDPPVVVRPVLRPGPRRADAGPARDHVVQPQLAEPHGRRRRGLPREPRRRRRLGAPRLHGAAERARPRLGRRGTTASEPSGLTRQS